MKLLPLLVVPKPFLQQKDTVRKGDVFDLPVMIQAISGAEAVISCRSSPQRIIHFRQEGLG